MLYQIKYENTRTGAIHLVTVEAESKAGAILKLQRKYPAKIESIKEVK